MGNPVFRFQLSNEHEGTIQISEPIGWKQAKLKLERHPEFYSLIEYFEGDFIFYGDNGVDNGGINFIKQVERKYGVDAQIDIYISISFDNGEQFEPVFSGQLDLSGLQELKNNKLQVPIIRNDFWSKFINRKDTPVDLQSTTDLDGNASTVIDPVDLNLPSQKVQQQLVEHFDEGALLLDPGSNYLNYYVQFDPPNATLDEINEKSNIRTLTNPAKPVWILELEYEGSYSFDLRVEASRILLADPTPQFAANNLQNGGDYYIRFYFQKNDETPIQFSILNHDDTLRQSTSYTYNAVYNLNKGDKITVYGFFAFALGGLESFLIWGKSNDQVESTPGTFFNVGDIPSRDSNPSRFNVLANTTYASTSSQGFLLHDAMAIIVKNITGVPLSFYSEFMGSTQTNARTYLADGCGWKFVVIQGLQIRSYLLVDKQFSMSFDKSWKGANPILNLGLGYETINGIEVIRVEEKDHWFDKTTTSLNIDNVYEIIREHDNEKLFKKIEVGYNKWQSEDISGIDDPQTKRTYATRFQKVGNPLTLYSDFIAASLAIEVTRRRTIEKSKDYKFDNDVFIIAINGDDVSPDRYEPELSENFASVTNLLNADTRYNLTITPLRNMLRWMNFIVGGLQKYLDSSIKFTAGEGNYDMVSDYNCAGNSCASVLGVICDPISEKDDIVLDAGYGGLPTGFFDFLFIPQTYKIEIDLPWDDYVRIRSNPKKAIGISQTETGHKKFFIKLLEYEVVNAKATMTLWPAEDFDIVVPEFTAPSQECIPPEVEESCENAITDELGEDLVDENGDCIIA